VPGELLKPSFTLRRQLLTCIAMISIATLILYLSHQPLSSALLIGLKPQIQIALGLAIGIAFAATSYVGFLVQSKRQYTRRTVASYSRFDLSGFNPLWIGLAAGIGEELLFRGALQPLLGLWLTSAIFVTVHVRAYQFKKIDAPTLVQAAGLFVVSVLLGWLAKYVGLIAAILVHALIDIVSLYAIHSTKGQQVGAE
jgi:membrane protease YdiL (CAAX protease family)